MKDWTGNQNSVYKTLGASNHAERERELNDYYATDPKAVDLLLEQESFSHNVWECACGEGHLSERLKTHGHGVISSDIIDRGYTGTVVMDFFEATSNGLDIITNPPYKYAKEFIEHALEISSNGTKIAMFLKLQFLEGKARRELFKKYPPKVIYVSSARILCAKNGDFGKARADGSAVAYAWFVWKKGFKGEPVVRWVN